MINTVRFDNPLDSMPIANGDAIPRPEEEIADDFAIENPDESDEIEEEKMTMHEKMYRIATAKYNPFSLGGSETLGGSENRT